LVGSSDSEENQTKNQNNSNGNNRDGSAAELKQQLKAGGMVWKCTIDYFTS
jgi:hypothetical protein